MTIAFLRRGHRRHFHWRSLLVRHRYHVRDARGSARLSDAQKSISATLQASPTGNQLLSGIQAENVPINEIRCCGESATSGTAPLQSQTARLAAAWARGAIFRAGMLGVLDSNSLGIWGDYNTIRNWQGLNGVWLATTYARAENNWPIDCLHYAPDEPADVVVRNVVFGQKRHD